LVVKLGENAALENPTRHILRALMRLTVGESHAEFVENRLEGGCVQRGEPGSR
jgi:hypothetical protein